MLKAIDLDESIPKLLLAVQISTSLSLLLFMENSDEFAALSVPMVAKLKVQSHKWRMKAHDRAVDEAMALGFRCRQSAKFATATWHQEAVVEENEGSSATPDLQSNGEAVTNLLNNCLGSGILSVAKAVSKAGIAASGLMLVLSTLLNRFTLLLLVDSCNIAGMDISYAMVARHTLGTPGKLAVIMVFTCMGYLCLVSYLDGTKDALNGLLGSCGIGGVPDYILFACAALMNFPATFLRSLKSVAMLSSIAFASACIVLICTIILCGGDLISKGLPDASTLRWFPEDFTTFLGQVNLFAVVFCIQAGGSIVISSIQDDSRANKAKVASMGFAIAFTLNTVMGMLAYVDYTNTIEGNVVNMFNPKSAIAIICRVALLFLMVLSFMFMMIPCRTALLLFFFNQNEAKMEASTSRFNMMTLSINLCALLVAYFVSDVSVVMNFNGAIAANLVAWILPSAIYIKVLSMEDKTSQYYRPLASPKNLPYFALILFGFWSMITGILFVFGII